MVLDMNKNLTEKNGNGGERRDGLMPKIQFYFKRLQFKTQRIRLALFLICTLITAISLAQNNVSNAGLFSVIALITLVASD